MNTTNAVVGVGIITVAGRWSQEKPLDIKVAIGVGALALFLAAFNESYPELASKFAVLVLVAALFLYGPAIAKKAGLTK
jgi:hypothetical protein